MREAWPKCSPRDPAGEVASAAALLPQPCQATQAGDSQAPRCFGIWGNSSGMRWLPGTTLRAQGAWKGMKGLCFEIIRNTCRAGGCQLAAHSSLQLPVAPVVMGGPGGNALQKQQSYLKALDTGPTSYSRRKMVQPLLWAPEII